MTASDARCIIQPEHYSLLGQLHQDVNADSLLYQEHINRKFYTALDPTAQPYDTVRAIAYNHGKAQDGFIAASIYAAEMELDLIEHGQAIFDKADTYNNLLDQARMEMAKPVTPAPTEAERYVGAVFRGTQTPIIATEEADQSPKAWFERALGLAIHYHSIIELQTREATA